MDYQIMNNLLSYSNKYVLKTHWIFFSVFRFFDKVFFRETFWTRKLCEPNFKVRN